MPPGTLGPARRPWVHPPGKARVACRADGKCGGAQLSELPLPPPPGHVRVVAWPSPTTPGPLSAVRGHICRMTAPSSRARRPPGARRTRRDRDSLAQREALQPGRASFGRRHRVRELHLDLGLVLAHHPCGQRPSAESPRAFITRGRVFRARATAPTEGAMGHSWPLTGGGSHRRRAVVALGSGTQQKTRPSAHRLPGPSSPRFPRHSQDWLLLLCFLSHENNTGERESVSVIRNIKGIFGKHTAEHFNRVTKYNVSISNSI